MTNAQKVDEVDYDTTQALDEDTYETVGILLRSHQEILNVDHGYDPFPLIANSELLMIANDIRSLKSIYALFNQKMPDISEIATIRIDRIVYYVPFIHKVGVSYVDGLGNQYESHFRLDNQVNEDSTPNVNVDRALTNLNLRNVWDRINLNYHASFSQTRNKLIGRNNDHWDTPNKRFIVPGGDQDQFYLRFTTDGKHNILPIGCHFNIDLCFMLNTTNNTATGTSNHDSFK